MKKQKYETFKNSIHELFPLVYDTKHLSFELKNVMNKETWKSNILCDLYSYFKDGAGKHLVFDSPQIKARGGTAIAEKEQFHDAGWDSYCTGYCFVRMAHIYACKKLGVDRRDLTNAEIMSGVKERANRVNLIRADLSHLRLDSVDPPSNRPHWLHVKTESNNITTRQLALAFSSFGTVDVKRYSSNCLLVAVPNHRAARDILQHYQKSVDFHVVPYHPLRHSVNTVKALIWAGSFLLTTAGIAVWFIHRDSPSKL